ncbi:hypothetical protein LEMLEM_LOCUS3003, partial [Lemmus lemmus]
EEPKKGREWATATQAPGTLALSKGQGQASLARTFGDVLCACVRACVRACVCVHVEVRRQPWVLTFPMSFEILLSLPPSPNR